MIHRLSNVIYWLFSGIAAIIMAFAIFRTDIELDERAMLTGLAAISWVIGRAIRYVIQGI